MTNLEKFNKLAESIVNMDDETIDNLIKELGLELQPKEWEE